MDPLKFRFAGASAIGKKREHNEDAYVIVERDLLTAVADGVGGFAAGEVASRLAIEEVTAFYDRCRNGAGGLPFRRNPAYPIEQDQLASAIRIANLRVYNESHGEISAQRGMGTTLVVASIRDGAITIGHLGDSRCYRLRHGKLEALTRDHSLYQEMLESEIEIREQPFRFKNVITKALGPSDDVHPPVRTEAIEPGDRYLLCTDGLTGMVTDAELAALLTRDADIDDVLPELITAANDAGGNDNITAVLIAADATERHAK